MHRLYGIKLSMYWSNCEDPQSQTVLRSSEILGEATLRYLMYDGAKTASQKCGMQNKLVENNQVIRYFGLYPYEDYRKDNG